MNEVLFIFTNSATQLLWLFGSFLVSGLVLTLLARWTNNVFKQSVAPRFGIYFFGWLGVPVHELSHALFCKLFFHKIEKVKLFDPKGASGAHGFVTHSYRSWNLYHRIGHFFIGLGPVLLAPPLLALTYRMLVPAALNPWSNIADVKSSVTHAGHFLFPWIQQSAYSGFGIYVFSYIALCICSQVELSKEDLKQAFTGAFPLAGIFLFANALAWGLGFQIHAPIVDAAKVVQRWILGPQLLAILLAVAMFGFTYVFMGTINLIARRPFGNPFRS